MAVSASEVGRGGSDPPAAAAKCRPSPPFWRLTSRTLLACVGVIAAADLVIWLSEPPLGLQALFDESAHAATGVLALAAVGVAFKPPIVLAVIAGSVLIDVDHVPRLLGSDVLQDSAAPRPYTHSLLTVILLAAAALLMPRPNRKLLIVAALALILHLLRDMAEPGGSGVALLWPLSDRAYSIEYGVYAAVLGLLTVIAVTRRAAASVGRRPIS